MRPSGEPPATAPPRWGPWLAGMERSAGDEEGLGRPRRRGPGQEDRRGRPSRPDGGRTRPGQGPQWRSPSHPRLRRAGGRNGQRRRRRPARARRGGGELGQPEKARDRARCGSGRKPTGPERWSGPGLTSRSVSTAPRRAATWERVGLMRLEAKALLRYPATRSSPMSRALAARPWVTAPGRPRPHGARPPGQDQRSVAHGRRPRSGAGRSRTSWPTRPGRARCPPGWWGSWRTRAE